MGHDNPEFDAFVRDNLDGLLRTAYLIAWDAKEAEDLVQECLFKVARRWGRVQAPVCSSSKQRSCQSRPGSEQPF
jgi:DNA-directed RNA polymerase specialized sigma24 family protein